VALAQRPDILLLDEPTTFLDIAHQLELLALLYDLKDHGVTVLMSMHDLLLTSLYCQRVIVVHEGRIAAHGPTEDVLTTNLVREIFGVEAEYREDATTGRRLLVPVMITRKDVPSNGHTGVLQLSGRDAEASPH
jgi:iron complex transport system ATP-binding protein